MNPKLRFAVIGHPVGHSVSPAMHRAALKALQLPHSYDAIDVAETERIKPMVDALRDRYFGGLNVTVPHKRAVLAFVDRVDESAERLGAANTLVRSRGKVIAYNTDVAGLADDLRGLGARGRTAVVIGSGGGASAAIAACASLGAKIIAVTSRSWTNSDALVDAESAERLRAIGAMPCSWPSWSVAQISSSRQSEVLRLQWQEIAEGADIIVQATSAGMKGGDSGAAVAAIVPWKKLKPDALAYDLVYNPVETPFLKAAKEHGIAHANGLGMLARQGAEALALWLQVTPDVNLMRAAAARALSEGR